MIKGEIRKNQILDLIVENPGINFRDIMRLTGLKNGVISYHIKKLEKKNKVAVKRRTGNTRFFPLDIDEHESVLFEMLRRPTPNEIIILLSQYPDGLTLGELIGYTNKAQSTISSYLQLLHSKKIIGINLYDRKKIFVLRNMVELQQILEKYKIKKISNAVQNFNEMFESL